MSRFLLICIFVLCPGAFLLADVVHMTDGRKIKGKIVSETEDFVLLKGKYGEVKLKRHEIDRIERGPVEEEKQEQDKPPVPKEKKPRPASFGKSDLDSLVDKAAKGDSRAAQKLIAAKRAALMPISRKLKEVDGKEKERLQKLQSEIEEKTQAEKEEAEKHYQKAAQIQKQCTALNEKMGKNPTEEQRHALSDLLNKMEEELIEAFELDPANSSIFKAISNLTLVNYHSRLYSKTMKLLQVILLIYPEETKKQEMLASCYYALRKYKDARKLIDKILEKDPENHNAWAILGYIDLEEKKFDKAINDFEKAISFNEDNAGLYYNLAIAYKCKKKYDKASESLEECLKKEPNHQYGILEYGKVAVLRGELEKAIEMFEKYCKLFPKDKYTPSLKKEIPKLKKKLKK